MCVVGSDSEDCNQVKIIDNEEKQRLKNGALWDTTCHNLIQRP